MTDYASPLSPTIHFGFSPDLLVGIRLILCS